ncbi:TIGR04141 family sporadically distributed protein [Proteus mirabilis]|uniref:TIGR04141 family sporadically distributed protein n=1 Tax=Proteus mirabilis TaxID=584 RepID=UPI003CFEAB07
MYLLRLCYQIESLGKKTREVLRRVSNNLSDVVPLDNFNSRNYEIVYLILGDENNVVKGKLPFFSKINLCKAYDNLTQRGFTVTICGVGKERLNEN